MPTTDGSTAAVRPERSSIQIGPLGIEYDDRVLTPRPWTQEQAAWAAAISADLPAGPLLELCCGVGHIGLLATRLTGRHAVLVDSNVAAWELAEENARRAGLADSVEVRHGTVESGLSPEERFPLVLVDPPYIPSDQTGLFPEDPLTAIDGGPDGLDIVRVWPGSGGRAPRSRRRGDPAAARRRAGAPGRGGVRHAVRRRGAHGPREGALVRLHGRD